MISQSLATSWETLKTQVRSIFDIRAFLVSNVIWCQAGLKFFIKEVSQKRAIEPTRSASSFLENRS